MFVCCYLLQLSYNSLSCFHVLILMQQDTDVIVEWIDKELVLETQHRQSPIAATYQDVDSNALF